MIPDPQPVPVTPPKPRSRLAETLGKLVRARITAGLIVVLPIWVTYLLVKFVFELMRDASIWVVDAVLHSEWIARLVQHGWPAYRPLAPEQLASPAVQWGIGLFSVLLTIILLYLIGLAATSLLGKQFILLMERLVDRLPLVKTVYRASKQILETFSSTGQQGFQRVALVPLPGSTAQAVMFVTRSFTDPNTGVEFCNCFYPTVPNPTTGFFMVFRRADITPLDWTVDDAVRAVMSAGIVWPANTPVDPAAFPRPQSVAPQVSNPERTA